MNPKIHNMALEAGGSTYPEVGGRNLEKFAELLVQDIVGRLDAAADLAAEQDQAWTAATLQSLVIDILMDYDMEMPELAEDSDDWDAEAELQKIIDQGTFKFDN